MIKEPFNDGWHFSARKSPFEQIGGGEDAITVTLPHDAMLLGGRSAERSDGSRTGYFKPGAWQYEKTFEAPQEWSTKRVTFEFEGVYRDAMVYINGALAGQWANGYSTFHVAADPYLRYGAKNVLRVEAQAHEDSRWYSGGGIYRPVHVLVGELVHIAPDGLRVTTPQIDTDMAVAAVTSEVANEGIATRTVDVVLEIRDGEGCTVARDHAQVTVLAGEHLTVRQRAYVKDPSLWSVDTPNLYSATVWLADQDGQIDEATTKFGIRSLSLDPVRGLRINGEAVKLRGACIHHDSGVLGAATFAAAEERRVRLLKAAGFNAIRSAHNPMSVAMLEACDRLGVLVMDETFDMWTVSKVNDDYSRRFLQWWEKDVDALVAKDFNHPSVIFYSIGNEIYEVGTPHGARWGRLLAERVRAQDSTRLITNGVNGMLAILDDLSTAITQIEHDTIPAGENDGAKGGFNAILAQMPAVIGTPIVGDRIAESASVLDVLGLNYGDSRYIIDRETFPNRVVVGSETFPTQIDSLWKLVTQNSHVIGDFAWTGWDYLGEVRIGRPIYPGEDASFVASYPWLTASCGDIDITGYRRPISYYREVVFGLRSDPYLAVQRPDHYDHSFKASAWAWTDTVASWTWGVPVSTPITVEAYVDAEEVAFVLNGTEKARVPVGRDKAFVAVADLAYEPGVLEAVSYRAGIEVGRCYLRTATVPDRIEIASDRDHISAGTQDLAYVEINLVDAEGVVNPISDRTVTVEIAGPGALQGLGTGRPSTAESFLEFACRTYEGRALAVIRPLDSGIVTVTVKTKGLTPASISINVDEVVAGREISTSLPSSLSH